jgi:hypothetical protein
MGGDQGEASAPLLLNTCINTTAEEDNIILTNAVPNRRTTSVSRVLIPDDAAATLSFHKINYSTGRKMESNKRQIKCPSLPCLKPEEHRQILLNVSGRFSKGMNAILGKIYILRL